MPELPEVETMIRGVRDALTGGRIEDFGLAPCQYQPIAIKPGWKTIRKRILGARIEAIERFGKRIVFVFDSADRLVLEPRMTGLLLISDPPDPEHLRLRWKLETPNGISEFLFWDRRGLGTCTLFSSQQWNQWLTSGTVGPDALDMSLDQWKARLGATGREIKVALLDQRLVAGIGNLYASEILNVSGIHPAIPASRLSDEDIERIADATKMVLSEAIRYEGSTLNDGTYRNALNESGGYQNHHRVYAREGQACPACRRGEIVRVVQVQRATFFCPVCQPIRAVRARKK